MSAKGCGAAPNQAASVVSGASRCLVLLPVPGRSRTSETSPGPLPRNAFLPAGRRSGLVRERLRSGPKTGRLGCICCTAAVGFTAGSRQFADKSAPTKAKRRPARCRATRFCPQGVGADLSAKGCEAAPKQAASVVSGASRRLVLLPVPDRSWTSETSPGPLLEKPSALPDIH